MILTIEQEANSALQSLAHLEVACRSLLDIEIGIPSSSLLYPLDAPNITLREAIDYCRDTLTSELLHIEQGEAAEHLSFTFSEVAHNLPPSILREAIQTLHSCIEKMVALEQALVRLQAEARLEMVTHPPCSPSTEQAAPIQIDFLTD